ncbi:hypothetical protein D3C85_937130 [compost metagenome]
MMFILIIIIVALLLVILSQKSKIEDLSPKNEISNLHLDENFKAIYIKYARFDPTSDEIKDVKKQIADKGNWSVRYEWKLMTSTECRIEHQIQDGRDIFLTTVECEHEIKFPAATIERAILFKKIYESLQFELYHSLGWSSWKSKDHLD